MLASMFVERHRRGHVNHSFDKLGLVQVWHGVVAALELGAGQAVAGAQLWHCAGLWLDRIDVGIANGHADLVLIETVASVTTLTVIGPSGKFMGRQKNRPGTGPGLKQSTVI